MAYDNSLGYSSTSEFDYHDTAILYPVSDGGMVKLTAPQKTRPGDCFLVQVVLYTGFILVLLTRSFE